MMMSKTKFFDQFILILTFTGVFLFATRPLADPDMWWHLRAGQEMWNQGKILLNDVFSYTRYGASWVNAFWISDLVLYGLWKAGGNFALTLFMAFMAAAVMGFVYAQMKGSAYLRMMLLLLAMFGSLANWSPRPQLMSFLLLAILDHFLHIHRRVRRQPLWLLVPLFALWGNLHGGFIWGILLLLATIVGEIFDRLFNHQPTMLKWIEIRELTSWSVVGGIAVLANPNGIAIWRLPFYQIQVSIIAITEWLSPDFHQLYAHPLLWLLFLLIFGVSFSKERMSFVDLFKALGFAYMLFMAQRNMAPYALITTPIISTYLTSAMETLSQAPLIQQWARRRNIQHKESKPLSPTGASIVNALAAGILFLFTIINAYGVSQNFSAQTMYPIRAVEWIRQNHPNGRMFNSYNWGGYLTWSLQEYPVFIDGRADLYGNELLKDWQTVVNARSGYIDILETWDVQFVLLEPDWPVINDLKQNGWPIAYEDHNAVILTRPSK